LIDHSFNNTNIVVFCVATLCIIVDGYRRIDLTMDAVCSSETVASCGIIARYHNPKDRSLNSHRLQNLKPYIHNTADRLVDS
jgi:hypothetical protein